MLRHLRHFPLRLCIARLPKAELPSPSLAAVAAQMLRHLGDFPRRLRECCHAVYEYTPCPPVGYPEIEVGCSGLPPLLMCVVK